MISKNKIKLLTSLKIKKYREKNKLTVLEGFRLLDQAINFNADIKCVWLSNEALDLNTSFIKSLKSKGINYDTIHNKDLKVISDTQNSQGIIAEVDISKYINPLPKKLNNDVVILDNISDPGNLGTILRTCAWYGIKSIILTNHTADPFNFKCIRSGMGSHFYFNEILHDSTSAIVKFLKTNKYDILCADLKGTELSKIKLKYKWAMIFGSEAHGISPDFDKFNKLTIDGKKSMESLNVSVASGIILNHLINNY